MARRLHASGYDTVHTLELRDGNRTTDGTISAEADREGRAVVTKDADFVSALVLSGSPGRPLLVSTGNIGNDELERRLFSEMTAIDQWLREPGFVELTRHGLVVHDP